MKTVDHIDGNPLNNSPSNLRVRKSESENNIWLQPGTRAHMLVYRPLTHSWQLWTATNSRQGDSREWRGTYMEMHADGRCIQVDVSEVDLREITIRPATEYTEYNKGDAT